MVLIDSKDLTFLQFAAELRLKGQFCDVEFHVKDARKVMLAHKIIMMYYSPLLNKLISKDTRKKTYDLPNIKYKGLYSVIRLLYREISLAEFASNNESLQTAQYLELDLHEAKYNKYLRQYYAFNTKDKMEPVLLPYLLNTSKQSMNVTKLETPQTTSSNNNPHTQDSQINVEMTGVSILKRLGESLMQQTGNPRKKVKSAGVDHKELKLQHNSDMYDEEKIISTEILHKNISFIKNEQPTLVKEKSIKQESYVPSELIDEVKNTDNSSKSMILVTTEVDEQEIENESRLSDDDDCDSNNLAASDAGTCHYNTKVVPEVILDIANMDDDNKNNHLEITNDNDNNLEISNSYDIEYYVEDVSEDESNVNVSSEFLGTEKEEGETIDEEMDVDAATANTQFGEIHLTSEKTRKKKKGPFQCTYCEKVIDVYSHFERHLRNHTGEKPYQCSVCNRMFSRKGNLAVHEKIHQNLEKKFACEICESKFYNMTKLKHHLKHVHVQDEERICEDCGRQFKNVYNLKVHIANKHHGKGLIECTECEASFDNEMYLKRHMLTHTDALLFKCRHCDERFRTPTRRASHETSVHTKEEFICDVCAKHFNSRHVLVAHTKRVHGDDQPRECPICNKFVANYHNHMRMHRSYEKGDIFSCEECGKTFPMKTYLHQHMNIHKEKQFQCEICRKSFTFNASLQSHLKSCGKRDPKFADISTTGANIITQTFINAKLQGNVLIMNDQEPNLKLSNPVVINQSNIIQDLDNKQPNLLTLVKANKINENNELVETFILKRTDHNLDDNPIISSSSSDNQVQENLVTSIAVDEQQRIELSQFLPNIINTSIASSPPQHSLITNQPIITTNQSRSLLANVSTPILQSILNEKKASLANKQHVISTNPHIVISTKEYSSRSIPREFLLANNKQSNTVIIQGDNTYTDESLKTEELLLEDGNKDQQQLVEETGIVLQNEKFPTMHLNTMSLQTIGSKTIEIMPVVSDQQHTGTDLLHSPSEEQQSQTDIIKGTLECDENRIMKNESVDEKTVEISDASYDIQVRSSNVPLGEDEQGHSSIMTSQVSSQGISREELASMLKMSDDDGEDVKYVCMLTE